MNRLLEVLAQRRIHLLLACVVLLVLGPTPGTPALPGAVQTAVRAQAGGHPEAALAALETAVALQPDLPGLHVAAAHAALEAGNGPAALDHLDQADRLLPPNPERTCLRGIALQLLGMQSAALETWQSEAATCLQQPDILGRMAALALECGDRRLRLETLAALSRLEPDNAQVLLDLGISQAVSDPNLALPHLRAARRVAGSSQGLASDLIQVILDSENASRPEYTLAQVGQALARSGHWREASWAFEHAVALEPGYSEAQAYLGLAYDRVGQDGLSALLAAAAAAPDAPLPQIFLGYHWKDRRDYDQALEAFTRAGELDPDNPAIAAELGGVYEAMADFASAKAAFLAAVDLAPQETGFWSLVAAFSLHNEIEVSTLGLPAARNAVALRPDDPQALDALGHAHFLLGDRTMAERLLRRALSIDPLRAETQLHFGMLRQAEGDPGSALAAYQIAQRLDPGGSVGEFATRLAQAIAPPS